MRFLIAIIILICQSWATFAQDWPSLGDGEVYYDREVTPNYDVFEGELFYNGRLKLNNDTVNFVKWDGKKWTIKNHLLPEHYKNPTDYLNLFSTEDELLISRISNDFNSNEPVGTIIIDTNENVKIFNEFKLIMLPLPRHPQLKFNGKYYSYFTQNDTSSIFKYNELNQPELILKTACVDPTLKLKVVNGRLFMNGDTLSSFGGCERMGPSYFENGEWKQLGGETQVYSRDFSFFNGKYYLSAFGPNDANPDPNWAVQVFDSIPLPLPGDPVEQWIKIGHPDMYSVTQIDHYKGYLYALNHPCYGCTADKIFRYDGQNWEVFRDISSVKFVVDKPFAYPTISGFKFLKDELYVFGVFDSIDNQAIKGIARTKILNANNEKPVAFNDTLNLDEDQYGEKGLTQNDIDNNSDYLTARILIDASHGSTLVDGDEVLSYIPNKDFWGRDSVQYEAFDRGGLKDTAWLIININPVVDSIVCTSDNLALQEDNDLSFNPLENDKDTDSLIAGLVIIKASLHSNLVVNGDFSITIQPNENFWGLDSFKYKVCDSSNKVCDSATVFYDVQAQNDKPLSLNDTFLIVDTGYNYLNILGNDFDVEDGSPSQDLIIIDSARLNNSFIAANQLVYYRTTYPENVDTIVYKVCDEDAACDTATVFLNNQLINTVSVKNSINKITITPQPVKAGQALFIQSDQHILDVELFSIAGQMLGRAQKGNNQNQIIYSTQNLMPGIYVIKLTSQSGILTHKLIVN